MNRGDLHKDRPKRRNRRSIRLKGYDYAGAGAYFVTICAQNRECLFGRIAAGQMVLNDAGMMIQIVWDEIPLHYPGIEIDAFAIMPNHIHGIVVLVGTGPRACPGRPHGRPDAGQPRHDGQPRGVAPTLSLPDVIHRFKTMTTKRYTYGVKQYGWRRFNGKLWQRNYYEHVIRNDNELNRIREYITNNPAQWELDRENPNVVPVGSPPPWEPGRRGTARRAPTPVRRRACRQAGTGPWEGRR